jgi:VWFA-related protein
MNWRWFGFANQKGSITMKHKNWSLILIIPFLFFLAACGGGGGGGDGTPSTTAPIISSVTLFKVVNDTPVESLSFDIGDTVNIEINANDPGLDMTTLYISQFLLPDLDTPFEPISENVLPSQQGADMTYFFIEPVVIDGPAGNWHSCFMIVDGAGNESNEFCVNVVVNEDETPGLEVLPADYDFGIVTNNSSVETLETTIKNNGTGDLSVSDISLSDTTNFALNLNGGATPCGSATPTIGTGSGCTVTVDFLPSAVNTFSANLTIRSNDPTTPRYDMRLLGSKQDINAVSVKINQIEACPRPGLATVYASVTDQGGFPVAGLDTADFVITEAGVVKATTTAVSVDDTVTLSVALVLDYSGSITIEPVNVAAMQNAATSFVNDLGVNDEAEIIKYGTTIEVTQPFTSNKTLLRAAIQSTPNVGTYSALYDAVVQAITDISTSTKARRAIIIITDGMDDDGTGNQQSTNTINDAITDANGNGVPVFTVGLGSAEVMILQVIADETGGTYFDSPTTANLATIYQQLADLLFTDQYILTYTSSLADDVTGDLEVTATYTPADPDVSGTDTKTILACP